MLHTWLSLLALPFLLVPPGICLCHAHEAGEPVPQPCPDGVPVEPLSHGDGDHCDCPSVETGAVPPAKTVERSAEIGAATLVALPVGQTPTLQSGACISSDPPPPAECPLYLTLRALRN